MVKNLNYNSDNETESSISDNKNMSRLDNIPFKAYSGNEDYAFISYSHNDHEKVYDDIEKFHNEGINIWYDYGIPTGTIWKEKIKEKIRKSKFFILFLSENAINSSWVINEINIAQEYHIPFVTIYIEEFELPMELKWIDDEQAIIRYEYREKNNYYIKCIKEFKEKLKELKPPFPAYEGEEEYIFVDYAPENFEMICPEIVKFHGNGYNIWYKNGISNRNKTAPKILKHLEEACLYVLFMTNNSIESDAVLKRIHMIPYEKILLIYLDDIDKSNEMYKQLESRLSKFQSIFKNELSDEEYEKEYTKVFEECH